MRIFIYNFYIFYILIFSNIFFLFLFFFFFFFFFTINKNASKADCLKFIVKNSGSLISLKYSGGTLPSTWAKRFFTTIPAQSDACWSSNSLSIFSKWFDKYLTKSYWETISYSSFSFFTKQWWLCLDKILINSLMVLSKEITFNSKFISFKIVLTGRYYFIYLFIF